MIAKVFAFYGEEVYGLYHGAEDIDTKEKFDQAKKQYQEAKIEELDSLYVTNFMSEYMPGSISTNDVLVEFEADDDIDINVGNATYADYFIAEYSLLEYDITKLVPKRCIYGIDKDNINNDSWEEFKSFESMSELMEKMFQGKRQEFWVDLNAKNIKFLNFEYSFYYFVFIFQTQ